MNHCLLEVEVKTTPTLRFTQDNKTPIAEMEVSFPGLRPDDKPSLIKVIGWGNMAQDLQQQVSIGQKIILEGRLRMNTISRNDGTKEKVAELTLSKIHGFSPTTNSNIASPNNNEPRTSNESMATRAETYTGSNEGQGIQNNQANQDETSWNSAPLVPDTDEIPF